MKILLVSWSVLPNKGGSSIIVENLIKNFNKEEMVVLASTKLFQNNNIKRRVKVYYFFSELYFLGRGYRYFIWFRKLRFKALIQKIKTIIEKEKIEYIIGVYPNPFYCYAASIAAKEMNIPFSSYFHNSYADNIAITDSKAARIQKEIFDQSENVFVMSKGMQAFYKEKYQLKNCIPLVHTFNQFPNLDSQTGIPGANKKQYQLVAIGNFNESNMEATKRFVNAIKANPKYSLSLYTHVPKVLLRKRGLDTNAIEYKGFVNPEKVYEVLQEYDICVLTHGFTGAYGTIEYRTIFPTRTIPFLLSGKPIFAHSPSGSFLNDFIKENKCAKLVEIADEKAIINGLDEICNNIVFQKQLVAASRKTAEQFYGPTVVEKLKASLFKKKSSQGVTSSHPLTKLNS